jgi:hypothetical protein
MRVFHRTLAENIEKILADGFRDSDRVMDGQVVRGVWVSLDQELGAPEFADGASVVFMMIVPEPVFEYYEIVEEEKPYREACIPAAVLNQYGPPTIVN